MRRNHSVCLVLPIRNEAVALPGVLEAVPDWVDQIIVVDNGSTDGSGAIAAHMGAEVLVEPRLGYGAACATGLARARQTSAHVIVFMDGDGSDDPSEMGALVDPIAKGHASLVIGCRSGTERMRWHQRFGTHSVCRLLSIGFQRAVTDLGPFRAASLDALVELPLRDRGFGWTAEMQAQAYRAGLEVMEVDVSWRPGLSASEISGTWRGVLRAGSALVGHSLREIAGNGLDRLRRRPEWRGLKAPIDPSTQRSLSTAAQRVPDTFKTSRQFLGRQYAGCGALIGSMPRCDFACRGCYLGEEANRVPALALPAIFDQIDTIRTWLGEGGNLQITDGEMTLRDAGELVQIIQRARQVGLVPMLMTHGDALLRDPSLLHKLVSEAGLSEISIHIDTTQQGRRDRRYRNPDSERDLDPLREDFAALIRDTRAATGRRLEAATTVTVTRENLPEVGGTVRCLLELSDAFKMLSFQPVARVGRTLEEVSSHVDVAELWEQISKGLTPAWRDPRTTESFVGWLGHPDCSHFVQGLVIDERNANRRFVPLLDPMDANESEIVSQALDRFGGLTFRLDDGLTSAMRILGLFAKHPYFIARCVIPQLTRSLSRVFPNGRSAAAWRWARGDLRVHYLNLVSHHFMSAEEIATPRGQERLDLCAFQVPIDGTLQSMCEVNALGLRDGLYERMKAGES